MSSVGLFRYANDLSNSYGREFAQLPMSRYACRSTRSFLINCRQLSAALAKYFPDDRNRRKNRRRKKKSPDKSGLFF